MLGLATDSGSREVVLRPTGRVPNSVARQLLLSDSLLMRGLPFEQALEKLFSGLPPGAEVYSYGLPHDVVARVRRWLQSHGPPRSIHDVSSAAQIAWPWVPDRNMDAVAAAAGLTPRDRRRPGAQAEALRECLGPMKETLASQVAPELLAECAVRSEALDWPRAPLFAPIVREAQIQSAHLGTPAARMESLLLAYPRPQRAPRFEPCMPLTPEAVRAILGPGGALSRVLGRYEARERQLAMSLSVAEALMRDELLLVEAGTGVGKSLAYLVPLALHVLTTGERAVVSTATKTLQDQLVDHDIPILQAALGCDLDVTVVKGRANYVCLRKLLEAHQDSMGSLLAEDHVSLLPILSWATRSETLDMGELQRDEGSPGEAVLARLAADKDTCIGAACPARGGCAIARLRAKAQASDLLVINHALFFTASDSRALPEFSRIVFDESHTLEDVATDQLGAELSEGTLRGHARRFYDPTLSGALLDVAKELVESLVPPPEEALELVEAAREHAMLLAELAGSVGQCCAELADSLKGERGYPRVAVDESAMASAPGRALRDVSGSVTACLRTLGQTAIRLSAVLTGHAAFSGKPERFGATANELEAAAGELRDAAFEAEQLTALDKPGYVFFLEKRGSSSALRAAPIEVGPLLGPPIYAPMRTVVLTSATLSVGGDMSYFVRRLGLDSYSDRLVTRTYPSEFDYAAQAVACIPSDLPDPREEDWIEKTAEAIVHLVRASSGRALVLFTARSHLEDAYELCADRLRAVGVQVYGQHRSTSRRQLMRAFTEEVDSVLFATRSFFEGIDVPGDSLQSVILTKLPFAVPTDPIVAARWSLVGERGGNPMQDYYVPQAVIIFRQAFGRLIRTRTDRGCLVLLDPRVLTQRYGKVFRDALPDCKLIQRPLDEVVEYLRQWFARS